MTFTPPERGPAVAANGHDRPDGRSGLDPAHAAGPLPQATLPELFGRLINDVSDLADRQIELAKQEIGEAKDEAIAAIKRVAIGAGIGAAAGLLLVIWAWTAFIWFFNWLFGSLFGVWFSWVGWLLGLVVPLILGYLAYRFVRRGISEAMAIWPPLPRTRETLKGDLEWVQDLRTRSAR